MAQRLRSERGLNVQAHEVFLVSLGDPKAPVTQHLVRRFARHEPENLEREKSLELSTSTLARLRSTN